MRTRALGKRCCNGRWVVDMTSQCQYVVMATVDEWENSYFSGLARIKIRNTETKLSKRNHRNLRNHRKSYKNLNKTIETASMTPPLLNSVIVCGGCKGKRFTLRDVLRVVNGKIKGSFDFTLFMFGKLQRL